MALGPNGAPASRPRGPLAGALAILAAPLSALCALSALSAVCAVCALCILGAGPAAAQGRAQSETPTPEQARALGAQAYDYGFPLLDMLRIRHEMTSVPCPDGQGNAPINQFANASKFAGPDDRTVVAPNTDTLYSVSHLDLRNGPIVLRHPDMGKRFFDFELVDPWTNVIGYVGTRTTGSKPGRFAIQWNGAKAKPRQLGAGVRVLKSKYRRVWLIGRTLAGDTADQAKAYDLMKKYKLTRPNGKRYKLPADCHRGKGEPQKYPLPTTAPDFIASLNQAMGKNPPPSRDDPFLAEVAPFGVGPDATDADVTVSAELLDAFLGGVETERTQLPVTTRLDFVRKSIAAKGWIKADPNIGRFGTDYAYRAQIAVVGIGANTEEEAIYPGALADSDGALLDGANDYRMVFPADDLPPARYFWSLTMYDREGFLVDNPIDRYSLGPSHPPLTEQPDGSIVVVVSHEEPTESGVNWLPSPAGGFRLNMRLYGPKQRALDWTWQPPPIVNVTP